MSDWIRPDGETQPVEDGVIVQARLANGVTVTAEAESFQWKHGDPTCDDVIQYRIDD